MATRQCKVVILDEVQCVFVGLNPDHIGYLYEQYGVFGPNYFFNPKFKFGAWDGKIRFFHKTAKTYVKLLDDILPRVTGLGYNIELEDRRESKFVQPAHIDANFFANFGVVDPKTGQPWIMRDYQIDLVNALIDNGGGVGKAGTGAGKSCCTAALAKSYEIAGNLRSMIIVPDRSLTIQTVENYRTFNLDVGEFSGKRKDLEHQHIVSTWQALQNRPELITEFSVVVVDECHKLKGNVLTKLMTDYGKNIPYRFGVTATLPKEKSDEMAVTVAVGLTQYEIPAHQLIEEGVLSDLHIDIIQHDTDLTTQYQDFLTEEKTNSIEVNARPTTYKQFKDSYFPDWTAEKAFLQRDKDRLKWIANFVQKVRDQGKGNTLCLVNGIKFGKRLQEAIPNSVFLYGDDDAKERKAVYDQFATNDDLTVIATVNIASTGLDIPRIFNLVFIDVGRSFTRVIQTIGRGLRKAHDKDFVNVFDICSDFKYSKAHLRERIKYYKESRYPYEKTVSQYQEKEERYVGLR